MLTILQLEDIRLIELRNVYVILFILYFPINVFKLGGGGSTLTVGANSKRCSTQFDTLTMGANSKHCSTQFYTLTMGANSKHCSTQFYTLTVGANSKHCSTQFYCFILKHVHATEESVALNKHIPVHTQFKGNNPFYILL